MNIQRFKRGQIWWYQMSATSRLDGNTKTRPVIIMSNDKQNLYSSSLIAIPCTTADKKPMATHLTFELDGKQSTALAENLTTIDKSYVTYYMGTVDDELMAKLENCCRIALGLDSKKEVITNNEKVEPKVEIKPLTIKEYLEKNNDEVVPVIDTCKKPGRKCSLSQAEKTRFLNDYTTHDIDFMMKKYNLTTKKAVQQRAYHYRKQFNIEVG